MDGNRAGPATRCGGFWVPGFGLGIVQFRGTARKACRAHCLRFHAQSFGALALVAFRLRLMHDLGGLGLSLGKLASAFFAYDWNPEP